MSKKQKNYTKLNVSIYEKEVFADYGYDNHELIDDTLVETIYKLADTKPIRENLELVIAKKEDVSFDEARFNSAYKNTILNKITSLTHEVVRCSMVGILLLLIGTGLLCVTEFLLHDIDNFLYQFATILSWVFCWGGIEVLAIQLTQLLIEKKKYKRLLKSKISFKN